MLPVHQILTRCMAPAHPPSPVSTAGNVLIKPACTLQNLIGASEDLQRFYVVSVSPCIDSGSQRDIRYTLMTYVWARLLLKQVALAVLPRAIPRDAHVVAAIVVDEPIAIISPATAWLYMVNRLVRI